MRPNLFVPSYVWTNHANFDNAASAVTERGRGRGGPPLAAIRKGRQNGVKFKKMTFLNLLSYVSAYEALYLSLIAVYDT